MKHSKVNSVLAIISKGFAIVFGILLTIMSLVAPSTAKRTRRIIRRHKACAISFAVLSVGLMIITYATLGSCDTNTEPKDWMLRLILAFIGSFVCGFISVVLFDHLQWYEAQNREREKHRAEVALEFSDAMAHQ